MARPAARLAAGALALALPLTAVAGCGLAKQRSIKEELASAQRHLQDAQTVSVTLRYSDPKGTTLAAVTDGTDAPADVVKDLLGASITVTVDAEGKKKLGQVQLETGATEQQLEDELRSVRLGIAVEDAKETLAEVRLVDGTLYARVGVAEVERVTGSEGSYADLVADAPEDAQEALGALGEGSWLTLPLLDYVDDLKEVAEAVPTPSAGASGAPGGVQDDLVAALRPHVKVTDANDDSDNRVLAVDVDARAAVKAVLRVLQGAPDLPFAGFLEGVTPTDVDRQLARGTAHATLTLSDGHLRSVALDVDSVPRLDPHAGATDLTGSALVLEIDDDADAVQAPEEDVSDVDVADLLEGLLTDVVSDASEGFTLPA